MENKHFKTVGEIYDWMSNFIKTLKENNKDPYQTPLFLRADGWKKFPIASGGTSFGSEIYCFLSFYELDEVKYIAPDSRPYVGGEYWNSRGATSFDCSGFVVSKLAGERLLRMVKYVLETDEPKSFLDYREREPGWIQFKFMASEFDVEKLDNLSKANDGIINEQILRDCKK